MHACVWLGTPSVSWTYAQRNGMNVCGQPGEYAQRTREVRPTYSQKPQTLFQGQPLYKEHVGSPLSLLMLIFNLRETLDLVFSPLLGVFDLGKLFLAKERLEGEKRSCQRRRRTCGACRSEEIPSFGACLRYKASCLTFILYRSMYFEALSPFLSQKSSPCCIFRFG